MVRINASAKVLVWTAALVASAAWAAAPVAQRNRFSCENEREGPPLRWTDSRGDVYRIVDLEFETSPFLPPYLGCLRWLEEVYRRPWLKGSQVAVRPLFSEGSDPTLPAKLTGPLAVLAYDACAKLPVCKVPFPYNLEYQALRWFNPRTVQNPREAADFLGEPLCQRGLSDGTHRRRHSHSPETAPKFASVDATPESHWFVPATSLAEQGVSVIRAARGGPVFLTAMVASQKQFALLTEAARARPDLKIFVMLDFALTVTEEDFAFFFQRLPPNFFWLANFNSPQRTRFFHLKGATDAGDSGEWVVTGANLRSSERTRILEMGFRFRDPASARDLALLIYEHARETCEELPLMECALEARFARDDLARTQFRGEANRFCSQVLENPRLETLRQAAVAGKTPRFFHANRQENLEKLVLADIASAKKSVVAFTHNFDLRSILRALEKKQREGVSVELWIGALDSGHPTAASAYPWVHRLDPAAGFEGHQKGLLIDGERVLLMSANLTRNGMALSDELAFRSAAPVVVQSIARYLETLRGFVPTLPNETGAWRAPASAPLESEVLVKVVGKRNIAELQSFVRGPAALEPGFAHREDFFRIPRARLPASCSKALAGRVFYGLREVRACAVPP